MPVDVIVENRSGREADDDAIATAASEVLKELGIDEGELGVWLVSAREIADLNRRHLGREGPTDVMSFPLDAVGAETVGEVPLLLGDVIICPEVAAEQAREAGRSTGREICLLLVHGILHIAGYDHETDSGEMESLQAGIFGKHCRQ